MASGIDKIHNCPKCLKEKHFQNLMHMSQPIMDRNRCLIVLLLLYICHTVIHRKLQNVVYMIHEKKLMLKKKEGWAIRSTIIGSCLQVAVVLKSVSDPMLCATFIYSIMSTGGH